MAMTDLPARLRALAAEMRDETAWVPTVPAMTVSGWADDLDALLGALETEPPRCDAERCVCGHFQCVHRGPSYRGVYTCEECECRGFQAAGAVGRAEPPEENEPLCGICSKPYGGHYPEAPGLAPRCYGDHPGGRWAPVRRAEPPDGWQDIATAPKDGTWIFGFCPRTGVTLYRWNGLRFDSLAATIEMRLIGSTSFWPPILWTPLPAPPVTERRAP